MSMLDSLYPWKTTQTIDLDHEIQVQIQKNSKTEVIRHRIIGQEWHLGLFMECKLCIALHPKKKSK